MVSQTQITYYDSDGNNDRNALYPFHRRLSGFTLCAKILEEAKGKGNDRSN